VLFADHLAAGIEAGVVRRSDPRRLAVLVLHLVFALVLVTAASGVPTSGLILGRG